MRLENLEYFLAIAEEQNVGRAALRLGVSQPALSKGLQRLEGELGFLLFERGPKGMTMTPPAHAFYARVGSWRSNLNDAIREASEIHLGALGVLRVGVSPLYIEYPFTPAAALLRRQRPAVSMQVAIDLNDGLLGGLRAGDLDVVICALEGATTDDLYQDKLFRDDLRIVARAAHPLAGKSGLTLADVVDQPWVLPRPGVAARRHVEARFAEKGLGSPWVAIEVGSTASQLAGLVAQSDLLTVMGERMLPAPQAHGLVVLEVKDGRWARQIGVTTRRTGHLPTLASRFIELLREVRRGDAAR